MTERQAAGHAPSDADAEVRTILLRADRLGLDPWRVLVALGIPLPVRERLLQGLSEHDGGPVSRQGTETA